MLALDEEMAPPPPPAPSAFDAEVRRQRAELRNLPEHAIRSIHLLEHGGAEERFLSDERQRRNAQERAKGASVVRAHAIAAKERAEDSRVKERTEEPARAHARAAARAHARSRLGPYARSLGLGCGERVRDGGAAAAAAAAGDAAADDARRRRRRRRRRPGADADADDAPPPHQQPAAAPPRSSPIGPSVVAVGTWPGSPVGDLGQPDDGAIAGLVVLSGAPVLPALRLDMGDPEEILESFGEWFARERPGRSRKTLNRH